MSREYDSREDDPVFVAEQEHLSATYEKLGEIGRAALSAMEAEAADAAQDKKNMADELSLNLATWDDVLEMGADIESVNAIVAAHNRANSVQAQRLSAAQTLLRQPYFAKITLQFKQGQPPRDLYIGSVGISDENYRRLVVDWRSPVAEVYYNQVMGQTSYVADGRTINVDLLVRRQFDIERDRLIHYFDSDVAIQDSLLLASLSRQRTAHMQAITATIQKEQNAVIRHADVPVLLVAGVAGSGKTSVLMQRIAYLFYTYRDSLDAREVFLISPNPLFGRYVDGVLPDLGERNPEILTWEQFVSPLLPPGRGVGRADVPLERLRAIDAALRGFEFAPSDFCDIACEGVRLVGRDAIVKVSRKFENVPAGPHRVTLMTEEIDRRLQQRLRSMAADEDVQDEVAGMTINEQLALFGEVFDPQTDEEARSLTLQYLERRYAEAVRSVNALNWINVDRIAQRLLGSDGLTSIEWMYLKMSLTGMGNPDAKYVLIDEVQDYSLSQLAVLARYFRRANFLLLGDPNQAITESSAAWSDIRELFENTSGEVSECSLTTSYRSTPAITDLFAQLLPPEERMKVTSVQRDDYDPCVMVCDSREEWEDALREAVASASGRGGLAAVIAPWRADAKRTAALLGDAVRLLDETGTLPDEGVVVVPLALAKGLEFDEVIVADASARVFPADDLSRRRLYTTISRATCRVTVLSRGPLTELLHGEDVG